VTAKVYQIPFPSKSFANFFFKPLTRTLSSNTRIHSQALKAGAKIIQLSANIQNFLIIFFEKSHHKNSIRYKSNIKIPYKKNNTEGDYILIRYSSSLNPLKQSSVFILFFPENCTSSRRIRPFETPTSHTLPSVYISPDTPSNFFTPLQT